MNGNELDLQKFARERRLIVLIRQMIKEGFLEGFELGDSSETDDELCDRLLSKLEEKGIIFKD